MLGRLGIVMGVFVVGLMPAGAVAAPRDTSSTHAYLVAGYTTLHAVIGKWSAIETGLHKLDASFSSECPKVGAGGPQSEEEQRLAYEVAGALWATAYHTDAGIIRRFVKAVRPLRWSDPAVNRSVRRFATGLQEMTALSVPDLCGDVRAWIAGGFNAVSPTTERYDKHVEAIEVKQVPRRLLIKYVQPSDRSLLDRVERLDTRFSELEFTTGQDSWNSLLETLALNQ
jgi:hypothetical protein